MEYLKKNGFVIFSVAIVLVVILILIVPNVNLFYDFCKAVKPLAQMLAIFIVLLVSSAYIAWKLVRWGKRQLPSTNDGILFLLGLAPAIVWGYIMYFLCTTLVTYFQWTKLIELVSPEYYGLIPSVAFCLFYLMSMDFKNSGF